MAQVTELVRKTKPPTVDIPPEARISLGRCDSPAAIRRASRRTTQALLDGKLDRDIHNAVQYGLALMLKASEAEREEIERERARQPASAGAMVPAFNVTFENGGPGMDDIEVSGLTPDEAAAYTYERLIHGHISHDDAGRALERCVAAGE